jgi:hypothetical protein
MQHCGPDSAPDTQTLLTITPNLWQLIAQFAQLYGEVAVSWRDPVYEFLMGTVISPAYTKYDLYSYQRKKFV